MIRVLGSTLIILLLVGCGTLMPSESTSEETARATSSIANRQTQSFSAVLEAAKPVTHDRSEISYSAESGQQASSDQAAWFERVTQIPMGVKLLLLAAGGLAIFFVVRLVMKHSAAATAVAGASDEAIASTIRWLRQKATSTTDPQVKVDLQGQVAELEAQRGRMKKG